MGRATRPAGIVVLVMAGILLAGCGAASAPTQAQPPQPTVLPLPTVITNPAEEYQATIGEAVPIEDGSGNPLGTVTVLKSKEVSTLAGVLGADRGRVFVRARVRYVAQAEYGYNYLDWVAHDDKGTQYEVYGYLGEDAIAVGTLASGRTAEGWITFDVPKATKHLWVDYRTYDGAVIFSVPLF